jgi:hypothetical protein
LAGNSGGDLSRTVEQWRQLAEKRVRSILAKNPWCPLKTLEAKISEAGPGDCRPNPHLITVALKNLTEKGIVKVRKEGAEEEGRFYALKALLGVTATDEEWMKQRGIYLVYRALAGHQEYCGSVLERIVDSALEKSGAVSKFEARFPDCGVPRGRPLDFVVEIGGVRFGVEAKNIRKWLYPDSLEIWETISKCCELDVVPIIVARKFHHVSFTQFKAIGGLGFQTHFQFFHSSVASEMERVRAVNGLGFKDIRFGAEVEQNLKRFFEKTVARMAESSREKFDRNKKKLREFADTRKLADKDLGVVKRSELWEEARQEFLGPGGTKKTEEEKEF